MNQLANTEGIVGIPISRHGAVFKNPIEFDINAEFLRIYRLGLRFTEKLNALYRYLSMESEGWCSYRKQKLLLSLLEHAASL